MGELLESHPLRDLLFGRRLKDGYDAAGIRILTKGNAVTQKAPSDGFYTIDGGRFLIKKGDALPPGATFAEKRERPAAERKTVVPGTDAKPLDGNAIAAALESAGFYMIKSKDLAEPIEGELLEISIEDMGEHLAEQLRAAGYELKTAKPKGPKDGATGPTGPSETTVSTGPSETT